MSQKKTLNTEVAEPLPALVPSLVSQPTPDLVTERELQPPANQLEPPPRSSVVTEEVSAEPLVYDQIEAPQAPEVVESPIVEESTPIVTLAEGDTDNEWHVLLTKLTLGGMAKQLAEHCLLKQLTGDKMILLLEASGVTLKTRLTEEALQEALSQYVGRALTVEYDVVTEIAETPAQRRVRHGKELQQQAEQSIEDDPFVQQLRRDYGGVVLPSSVRPHKVSD